CKRGGQAVLAAGAPTALLTIAVGARAGPPGGRAIWGLAGGGGRAGGARGGGGGAGGGGAGGGGGGGGAGARAGGPWLAGPREAAGRGWGRGMEAARGAAPVSSGEPDRCAAALRPARP